MSNKKTEGTAPLATQTDDTKQALANQEELVAFLGEYGKEGKENITSDDILIPRLAILQALSPAVKEKKGYAGDIFNTVTKVNYGSEGITFIPLFFYSSRICFSSNDPGANIECTARDGLHGSVKDGLHGNGICARCPQKEFTTNAQTGASEQPRCTEFKNVLALPLPEGESPTHQVPVIISGKRAAIGVMKQFLSEVQAFRYKGLEMPMYARIFRMIPKEEKGQKGDYFNPSFESMGLIQDLTLARFLQGVYRQMKEAQSRFVIDDSEYTDAQFTEDTSAASPQY